MRVETAAFSAVRCACVALRRRLLTGGGVTKDRKHSSKDLQDPTTEAAHTRRTAREQEHKIVLLLAALFTLRRSRSPCARVPGPWSMGDSLVILLNAANAPEYLTMLRDRGATLGSLNDILATSRPKLLSSLKDLGVTSLSKRQAVANALQKLNRNATEGGSNSDQNNADPGPAPPGSITVNVKVAGVLGGENCPLNNKLRQSRVHTKASSVRELFDELAANRGYTMTFDSVRVSVDGAFVDVAEASGRTLNAEMTLIFVGPNRGG